MKNKYSFLCLLLLLQSIGKAQDDRNSLWLQGVGKGSNSIRGYAQLFMAERKMTAYQQDYTTTGATGIPDVATTVAATASGQFSATPSTKEPIVIGHDMGGLMARKMENNFGGMILKGTPNKGMPILAAYQHGELGNFALQGDDKLNGKASLSACINGDQTAGISPAQIPSMWAKSVFGPVKSLSPAVLDLNPASGFIQGLTQPTKPVAVIWGNENEPSMWRFFSSGCGDIGSEPPGSKPDDSDLSLTNAMQNKRDEIKSKRNWAIAGAIVSGLGTVVQVVGVIKSGVSVWNTTKPDPNAIEVGLEVPSPPKPGFWSGFWDKASWFGSAGGIVGGIIMTAVEIKNAHDNQKAMDWLDDAPTMWNSLIGAVATNTITTTSVQLSPTCQAMVTAQGWGAYYSLTSAQQQACYVPVTTVVEQFINGPSDGLLSKYTQTNVSSVLEFSGLGANHEEELNHGSITNAYNNIFDSEIGVTFETKRRKP